MKQFKKKYYFNKSFFTILKLFSLKKSNKEDILKSKLLKEQKAQPDDKALRFILIENLDLFKEKLKSISDIYLDFLNKNCKIKKAEESYTFYKRDMTLWLELSVAYEVNFPLVEYQLHEDEFGYNICNFYDFFTLTQKTELIIQLFYIEYIKQKCANDLNAILYTDKLINILKNSDENVEISNLIKEYEFLYLTSIGNVDYYSNYKINNYISYHLNDEFKKSHFYSANSSYIHSIQKENTMDFINKEIKSSYCQNIKIYLNYLNFDDNLKEETYQQILSDYLVSENKIEFLRNKKKQYFKYILDEKLLDFFTYLDIIENVKDTNSILFLKDFVAFINDSEINDKSLVFDVSNYKDYYLNEYFLISYQEKFNNLIYLIEYLKVISKYKIYGIKKKLNRLINEIFESSLFKIMKNRNILQIAKITNYYYINLSQEELLKL